MKKIILSLILSFSFATLFAQSYNKNLSSYAYLIKRGTFDSTLILPYHDTTINSALYRPGVIVFNTTHEMCIWNGDYWNVFKPFSGGGDTTNLSSYWDSLQVKNYVTVWVNGQGFLKTEVEPIFTTSVAYNITAQDTLHWDSAYVRSTFNDSTYKLYFFSADGRTDSMQLKAAPFDTTNIYAEINSKQDTGNYAKGNNTISVTAGNPAISIGGGTQPLSSNPNFVVTPNNTMPLWNAVQLQGLPILNTAPSAGQVLFFNGTSWTPYSLNPGSGTVTSVGLNAGYGTTISSNTTNPITSSGTFTTSVDTNKIANLRYADSALATKKNMSDSTLITGYSTVGGLNDSLNKINGINGWLYNPATKTGQVDSTKYSTVRATHDSIVANIPNLSIYTKYTDTSSMLAPYTKKGELFINVKDYGAKGDTTTIDTAAIQNAILAAKLSHEALYFPAGSYNLPITQTFDLSGIPKIFGSNATLDFTGVKTLNGNNVFNTSAINNILIKDTGSIKLIDSTNTLKNTNYFFINRNDSIKRGDVIFLVSINNKIPDSVSLSNGYEGERVIVDSFNTSNGQCFIDGIIYYSLNNAYVIKNTFSYQKFGDGLIIKAPEYSNIKGYYVQNSWSDIFGSSFYNFGLSAVQFTNSIGSVNNSRIINSIKYNNGYSYGISVQDLSNISVNNCYIYGGKDAITSGGGGYWNFDMFGLNNYYFNLPPVLFVNSGNYISSSIYSIAAVDIHNNTRFSQIQNSYISGLNISGETSIINNCYIANYNNNISQGGVGINFNILSKTSGNYYLSNLHLNGQSAIYFGLTSYCNSLKINNVFIDSASMNSSGGAISLLGNINNLYINGLYVSSTSVTSNNINIYNDSTYFNNLNFKNSYLLFTAKNPGIDLTINESSFNNVSGNYNFGLGINYGGTNKMNNVHIYNSIFKNNGSRGLVSGLIKNLYVSNSIFSNNGVYYDGTNPSYVSGIYASDVNKINLYNTDFSSTLYQSYGIQTVNTGDSTYYSFINCDFSGNSNGIINPSSTTFSGNLLNNKNVNTSPLPNEIDTSISISGTLSLSSTPLGNSGTDSVLVKNASTGIISALPPSSFVSDSSLHDTLAANALDVLFPLSLDATNKTLYADTTMKDSSLVNYRQMKQYVSTNAPGGTGTVTSVGMTVPTGLTISGSPITTTGTLALGLQSGYSIPTTANQTIWTNKVNISDTANMLAPYAFKSSLGQYKLNSDSTSLTGYVSHKALNDTLAGKIIMNTPTDSVSLNGNNLSTTDQSITGDRDIDLNGHTLKINDKTQSYPGSGGLFSNSWVQLSLADGGGHSNATVSLNNPLSPNVQITTQGYNSGSIPIIYTQDSSGFKWSINNTSANIAQLYTNGSLQLTNSLVAASASITNNISSGGIITAKNISATGQLSIADTVVTSSFTIGSTHSLYVCNSSTGITATLSTADVNWNGSPLVIIKNIGTGTVTLTNTWTSDPTTIAAGASEMLAMVDISGTTYWIKLN